MARHDTAVLDGVPRKSLSMGSEALRKPVADDTMKRAIGRAIEHAIEDAHLTKQAVAAEMGYADNQAPLSRWIAGIERPQFDKLFSVRRLQLPLVLALADLAGADVVTQITIRRRA